jgi:hypothetical protein
MVPANAQCSWFSIKLWAIPGMKTVLAASRPLRKAAPAASAPNEYNQVDVPLSARTEGRTRWTRSAAAASITKTIGKWMIIG